MAYVAITKRLIADTDKNMQILQSREKESVKAVATANKKLDDDPSFHELFEARCWGDVIDLKDRLTPYNRKASWGIRLAVQPPQGSAAAKLHTTYLVPQRATPVVAKFIGYSQDVVTFDFTPEDHPLLQELHDAILFELTLEVRWGSVRTQVVAFLEKAKSLNEAVKLWPDLRSYVPSDYLNDLDRKIEKAPKADKPISDAAAYLMSSVDMEAARTTAILARMSNGGNGNGGQ